MLFFKKRKERKANRDLEELQDDIKIKRALGANYVCLPLNSHNTDLIKGWCEQEGYKFEVDHMNEEGMVFYKISGWD